MSGKRPRRADSGSEVKGTSVDRSRAHSYEGYAEVRPHLHPELQGQNGVFAVSAVEKGCVVYTEIVPLLEELPSGLEGTDHYIALERTGAKTKFAVLKRRSFVSMSYSLNSAAAPHQGGTNVLDPDQLGPNVHICPTYRVQNAVLTVRATRPIKCGEELLWTYDLFGERQACRSTRSIVAMETYEPEVPTGPSKPNSDGRHASHIGVLTLAGRWALSCSASACLAGGQ